MPSAHCPKNFNLNLRLKNPKIEPGTQFEQMQRDMSGLWFEQMQRHMSGLRFEQMQWDMSGLWAR